MPLALLEEEASHLRPPSIMSLSSYIPDRLRPMGTSVPGVVLRQYYRIQGFKGDPELGPHDAETRQPLGQLLV